MNQHWTGGIRRSATLQEGGRPAKAGFGKTGQQAIDPSNNSSESLDLLALTMDSPNVRKHPKEKQRSKVPELTSFSTAKNGSTDQCVDSLKWSGAIEERDTKGEYEDLTSMERQMFADLQYTR